MLLLDLEVTPRDVMMLLDLEVTSWGLEATVRPSPLSPSPDEGWSTGNIFLAPLPWCGDGGHLPGPSEGGSLFPSPGGMLGVGPFSGECQ